jgi:DNA repair photolyase
MDIEYETIKCRRLLKKPDKAPSFNCNYVVFPYSGCEYGCVYCYECMEGEASRDSPKTIKIKENAPSVLKKELKNAQKGVVCLVGYQPVERKYRIMRKVLEVLSARRFPVHIITKSDIVLDDLDILTRITENGWCAVTFSLSALDEEISNIFEPDVPSPNKRIKALEKVLGTGIYAGIALNPIIPYISDSEERMEDVIRTAADLKVRYVLPMPLILKDDCRTGFINVIKRHFPELLVKYRRLYEFGSAPDVRYSKRLRNRMNLLLKKYDITDIIPKYPEKEGIKQVNIHDFI